MLWLRRGGGVLLTLLCLHASAAAQTLKLFLDADFKISSAAADAIHLGVSAALSQVDNRLGGVEVELLRRDHRGNSKRSYRTLEEASGRDDVLAIIGGMHSPP